MMIRVVAFIALILLCTLAILVPAIAISEFVMNYNKKDK